MFSQQKISEIVNKQLSKKLIHKIVHIAILVSLVVLGVGNQNLAFGQSPQDRPITQASPGSLGGSQGAAGETTSAPEVEYQEGMCPQKKGGNLENKPTGAGPLSSVQHVSLNRDKAKLSIPTTEDNDNLTTSVLLIEPNRFDQDGVYIWRDQYGLWQIYAYSQDEIKITGYAKGSSIDCLNGDELFLNGTRVLDNFLQFSAPISNTNALLEFRTSDDWVEFYILINGKQQPDRVFIGDNNTSPTGIPFQVENKYLVHFTEPNTKKVFPKNILLGSGIFGTNSSVSIDRQSSIKNPLKNGDSSKMLPQNHLFTSPSNDPSVTNTSKNTNFERSRQVAEAYLDYLLIKDPRRWEGVEFTERYLQAYDFNKLPKSYIFELKHPQEYGYIEVSTNNDFKVLRVALTITPWQYMDGYINTSDFPLSSKQELFNALNSGEVKILSDNDGYWLDFTGSDKPLQNSEAIFLRDYRKEAKALLPKRSDETIASPDLHNFQGLIHDMVEEAAGNVIDLEYEQGTKWLITLGVGRDIGIGGLEVVAYIDSADYYGLTPESAENWTTVYGDIEFSILSLGLWDLLPSPLVPVIGVVKQDPYPYILGEEDPDRGGGCSLFNFNAPGMTFSAIGTNGNGFTFGDDYTIDVSISGLTCYTAYFPAEVNRIMLHNSLDNALSIALTNGVLYTPEINTMISHILDDTYDVNGGIWEYIIPIRGRTKNDGSILLANGEVIDSLSANQNTERHYKIDVPVSTVSLEIEIWGGTGNADLYVRHGEQPTTSDYDYHPNLSGNNETVTIQNPQSGEWYIMLRGDSSYSGVYLQADAHFAPEVTYRTYDTVPATNIYIGFSKDMDETSFTDTTIVVLGSSTGDHSCNYSFNHGTYELTIDPINDFTYGETVAIAINSVRDAWGNYLNEPYAFDFEIGTAPPPDPTSLIVAATLTPDTIPPYWVVNVNGTATYNTGENVPVGTVTINTGENVFTAAVNNGSFNRNIYAPSTSRYINITIDDDQYGLSRTIQKWLTIDDNGNNSGYDLTTDVIYDVVGDNTTVQWWSKDAFRTTDDFVSLIALFENININHDLDLLWRYYKPNGNQYGNDLLWENAIDSSWDWAWVEWGFLIDGHSMSYTPGRYKIKFYVDGDRKATHYYVIAWDFTEHRLCKDVQNSDPYLPIDETNVFFQTDTKAVTWANFDLVAQPGNVKHKFYEPNGALYSETTPYAFDDPGIDNWWDWYRVWGWIDIQGHSAASKTGQWRVEALVQNPTSGTWELYYEDYFEILENPNVNPNVSTNATPASPIETQAINLSVSAADNTYLKKVVLYWDDGNLHSQTWDNIYASSLNESQNIGSFSGGQQIDYWSVAWDTSGNIHESSHQSLSIGYETVSTPIRPIGYSARQVGQSSSYSTNGSTSNIGNPIEYQFDWGDGQVSSWGGSLQSHSWTSENIYAVKARARSQTNNSRVSEWSSAFHVAVDSTDPIVTITTNNGENFSTDLSQIVLEGISSDPSPTSGISSIIIDSGEPNTGTLANWSFTLNLLEGPNTFNVIASDSASNIGQDTIIITKYGAYSISGYVRNTSGTGVSGVSVDFDGARPAVTTNSSGYYHQTGFANGNYTISFHNTNYTFSPAEDLITLNGSDISFNVTAFPLFHPATPPFSDSFEDGILGSAWALETDYEGRVQVSNAYPHQGNYSLLLDDHTDSGDYSHAAAILTLDLAGQSNVELDFQWREFSDEDHTDDGVFISDDYGATWYQVMSFNGGSTNFTHEVIDLDAAVNTAGMGFNDHFLVKFQFYDNYSLVNDGYAIDEVGVTGDIIPSPTTILLVDDDDNSPNVRLYYTGVLDTLGLDYDVWDTDNGDLEPAKADLKKYSTVIWFTGEAFGGAAGPGANGEAALGAFLDDNKCLFISSQDYVYDRGLTSFMYTYLGVESATSDMSQTSVSGTGLDFGPLGPFVLSYPFDNYSDILLPNPTAGLAFTGDKGGAAVYKNKGVFHSLFLGFPFEALPTEADRQAVMSRFLQWCGSTSIPRPKKPTNLQASDNLNGMVQLTWAATSGATYYEVYKADTIDGPKSLIGLPTGLLFNDTNVSAGATYTYWLRACNVNVCSDYSQADTGLSLGEPHAPASIHGGVQFEHIQVSWSELRGATHYEVYRSEAEQGPKELLGSTSEPFYLDHNATAGLMYYYWVKACNEQGCGTFSPATIGLLVTPGSGSQLFLPMMHNNTNSKTIKTNHGAETLKDTIRMTVDTLRNQITLWRTWN